MRGSSTYFHIAQANHIPRGRVRRITTPVNLKPIHPRPRRVGIGSVVHIQRRQSRFQILPTVCSPAVIRIPLEASRLAFISEPKLSDAVLRVAGEDLQ